MELGFCRPHGFPTCRLQTDGDRLADSRAALERKAALYDRLTAGEMLDDAAADRYEVDFLLKGSHGGSGRGVAGAGGAGAALDTSELAAAGGGGLMSADMARERERRAGEAEAEAEVGGEGTAAAAAERRREVRGSGGRACWGQRSLAACACGQFEVSKLTKLGV